MANNKEAKNANFIDLEKTDFKKKGSFLVKLIIIIIIIISLTTFFILKFSPDINLFKDNIADESLKFNSDILPRIENINSAVKKNSNDFEQSNKKINDIESNIVFLKKELETFREEFNIFSKSEKIYSTESVNLPKSNVDYNLNNLEEYLIFDLLTSKFLKGRDFSFEKKILLKLLKGKNPDIDWNNRFSFLDNKSFMTPADLLQSLNLLIKRNQKRIFLDNNFDEDTKISEVKTLQDYKNYLFDLTSSLIKIKRVDEGSIEKIQNENIKYLDKLQKAKEYLLLGDINSAISKFNYLSKSEEENSKDLKIWRDRAKAYLNLVEKIDLLRSEIIKESFNF